MTVGELKNLLKDVSDEIPVYVGTSDNFEQPDIKVSGLSILEEPCDEDGNSLDDDGVGDVTVFLLTTSYVFESEEEE